MSKDNFTAALQKALSDLSQPTPTAKQDQHIHSLVAQRLQQERNAQLFEAAINDPASVPLQNLPLPVQKAVILYHATANSIASSSLHQNEIASIQANLLASMSKYIATGSKESTQHAQSAESTSEPAQQQAQDPGLTT